MDINCLRVMNSLYNLGLSESEFENIADEVSHTNRTGFSIKAVRENKIIGVSHDEKGMIVIKNKGEFKTAPKPNTRILLKTLITFDELPEEIYTLHTICHYRSLDTDIKHIANTLEELKEKVLERFSRKYGEVILADKDYYSEFSGFDDEKREMARQKKMELMLKQLKAIYWLFNETFDFEFGGKRKNIATIVKVFSAKNTRLAIIQENEEFEKRVSLFGNEKEIYNGIKLRAQTYKPNDERYNHVCEGREIYIDDDKEIWISDELSGQISEKEFKILINKLDGNSYQILTKKRYEMEKDSLRIQIMATRRKDLEEKGRKQLIREIKGQFKNGMVVRQGIAITPDSISYNGLVIKGDKLKEYIQFEQLPMRETLDFQNIVVSYIDYLLEKEKYYTNNEVFINFKGKVDLKIGNIGVVLEKRGNNFFVNDFKIRKDELSDVILKALKFSDNAEYNKWLKEISKISLRLQNALKDGITFTFVIDKSDDNCLIQHTGKFNFTLCLKMDRKIFITINGKSYSVQDINALFSLQKSVDTSRIQDSQLSRTIKLLYKGIKDISPKEIGEIISTAQIEYNERLKRSEDFLTKAITLSKARSVKDGWIVQGESRTEYFVGVDFDVYKMKNGREDGYLCLMDTETYGEEDEAQRNDRIAKRLLGLRHDLTVAKDIWDLGDKVDKWWRDIQQEPQGKMVEVVA